MMVMESIKVRHKTHDTQSGKRVHYLANLGGLVAIAHLDALKPDLLLGILLEVAQKLPTLSAARIAALTQQGKQVLSERGAEKRAFSAWQEDYQTQRFDLKPEQIKHLIIALGGKIPALEKDLSAELWRLLRK